MVLLSITDPKRNEKLKDYLDIRCEIGEMNINDIAEKLEVRRTELDDYLKQGKFFESLELLIKLCTVSKMNVGLYCGSHVIATPHYPVTYRPAWQGIFGLNLGHELKKARLDYSWTVTEVQTKAKMPKGTLAKMEAGKEQVYDLAKIHKIGEMLCVKFLIFIRITQD